MTFEARVGEAGKVHLVGRLDASQSDQALAVLQSLSGPLTADCAELEYISSAGLGVLVATHKRLVQSGQSFRIVNLQPRVRSVFAYSGLDRLLSIE